MNQPERALSLSWPWPHFMLALPEQYRKRIENRKPGFSHKSFRGECWVHVTPCKSRAAFADAVSFARLHGVPDEHLAGIEREHPWVGHIVGAWEIVGMLPRPNLCELPDRWRMLDQVGFVVANERTVSPVRCKGALGFWRVPNDVLAKLRHP